MGTSLPRFYGNPNDYQNFYSLVKNNKSYFDGYGTTHSYYIDDPANSTMVNNYKVSNTNNIIIKNGLSQLNPSTNKNVAAVLRSNGSNRVLHVVNWQGDTRSFTFYIPQSVFAQIPTTAYIVKPESTTPVQLSSQNYVYEKSKKRIKVTIPSLNVWSVVKFQ